MLETPSGTVVDIDSARDAVPPRASSRPPITTSDFRVDGWLVQPLLNRLTRDDVTVRLRPQLMDLLVCLASRPAAVLSRDQLVASVWQGRWVSDSAVSRCVAELRAIFEDSVQRPRIIETISKRGYRLIAPVEPVPAASLAVTETARRKAGRRPLRAWLARVAARLTWTLDRRGT